MGQSHLVAGYAILDMNGSITAADELFRTWLGSRPLTELLPDFGTNGAWAFGSRRMKVCRAALEPSLADVECRTMDGPGGSSLLLRIEFSADVGAASEYRDVVTGLPDRRALAEHRATLLEHANGKAPHAVLFMDLDNFKQINDSLGHKIGDRVLAVLAERWRKSLRGRDLIVRYGGDEFVVLLAGVRSDADVEPIVDRLRAATVLPIEMESHTLQVSVTIGMARSDGATVSLEELLDAADRAMYSAKPRGS